MYTNDKEFDKNSDNEQFATRSEMDMTTQSATGDDSDGITLPTTLGSGGSTTTK